eukprot:3826148-Alexandrium_andersonii.AAC.1
MIAFGTMLHAGSEPCSTLWNPPGTSQRWETKQSSDHKLAMSLAKDSQRVLIMDGQAVRRGGCPEF